LPEFISSGGASAPGPPPVSYAYNFMQGVLHQRCPQSGILTSSDKKGSALFSAKNFGFFEIFGVSAVRTRGVWASVNIVEDNGGGEDNVFRYYADVFYGRAP